MRSTPTRRFAQRLGLAVLVATGLVVAAAAQDLPSDTSDGTVLTSDETRALLNKLKDRLDGVGQPSEWIDGLLKDLPGVRFADDLGDTQAMYQPVSQGPFGRSGDTLYLRAGLDLNNLTESQLGLLTHEMWHAWFDFVPTYVPIFGSNIGGMSNAQDEAMGGFVEQMAAGNTLGDAIAGAITEAVNWKGTAQDAVNAIDIVEQYFGGSFFANGLPTDRDVLSWARVQNRYPELEKLLEYLSASDRSRVEARVAELAARDARAARGDEDPLEEPESAAAPTPAAAPEPAAPTTSATPSAPSTADAAEAVANTVIAEVEAAAAAVVDAAEEAAAAIPDCTPCVPIAAKLREAMRHRQTLRTDIDRINQRLGQIPAELKAAQQTRDDLQAEYERRLRQTRVQSGNLEAGYYEVGSTVYIGLGTTRDGKFVPDVVPDPDAPQDFGNASGPRRSPYMTRLKAKLDAADAVLAGLRAERDRLNGQLKGLTPQLAAAQTAVDTLQRELDACLKKCGQTEPIRVDIGAGRLPPLRSVPATADTSLLAGNPTDLLSGLNLYALQAGSGVPYAIARPDHAVDDQYQLFVVSFIRSGENTETSPGSPTRGASIGRPRPTSDGQAIATLVSAAPERMVLEDQGADIPGLSIVATGASSGNALTLEVLDAGGNAMDIVAPDGLVLQAVRQGVVRSVSQSGQPTRSTAITGFCLEYHKPPPPPGTVYQVAPNAVQQQFRAMRPVLEAGRAMADAGLLNPDSDADAYSTFITQWAVWTRMENWDEAGFTREFVAHTRRNVEEAGQSFTEAMREALTGAAPNRFQDILAVLVEADGLTGRLPFVLTP